MIFSNPEFFVSLG